MKEYKYIFFDFDGTIVNTTNGTRESALYALNYFGINENDNKDLGRIFCGPPLKESFSKYNLTDKQIEKAIMLYRDFQANNTIECNEIYDGIKEMLQELKENGKKCYIVTSKLEETAKKILRFFGIFDYFDLIVGATSDGCRNQKNEVIKYAIENIKKYNSENAIMIGDRPSDIKAGILNNMDTIGVLYGMDTKENLSDAGATYLINTPKEITEIVDRARKADVENNL